MRDPKRIKVFCDQLAEIWETECPDWRFGQLMSNVLNSMDRDPFFPEENEMLATFQDYFKRKDDGDA